MIPTWGVDRVSVSRMRVGDISQMVSGVQYAMTLAMSHPKSPHPAKFLDTGMVDLENSRRCWQSNVLLDVRPVV